MTSFLALQIDVFPKNEESGEVDWPLREVSAYLCAFPRMQRAYTTLLTCCDSWIICCPLYPTYSARALRQQTHHQVEESFSKGPQLVEQSPE